MGFCDGKKTNTAGNPEKSSYMHRKNRNESSRVIQSALSPQGSSGSSYPPSYAQAAQVNTFLSPKEGFPGAMPGSFLSLKPDSDLPAPASQTSPPCLRREQWILHLASSTYYFRWDFRISHRKKTLSSPWIPVSILTPSKSLHTLLPKGLSRTQICTCGSLLKALWMIAHYLQSKIQTPLFCSYPLPGGHGWLFTTCTLWYMCHTSGSSPKGENFIVLYSCLCQSLCLGRPFPPSSSPGRILTGPIRISSTSLRSILRPTHPTPYPPQDDLVALPLYSQSSYACLNINNTSTFCMAFNLLIFPFTFKSGK